MQRVLLFCALIISFSMFSQETSDNQIIKTIIVKSDTVRVDSISISPNNFKLLDSNKTLINQKDYEINFAKALLIFKTNRFINLEITVEYDALPKFLTKTYTVFDDKLIVDKSSDLSQLFTSKSTSNNQFSKPFNGLNTTGSLSRGITVGNNQDGVLNSNFDLQISGNLSKNVKIRANITDNNVPLQENGYTQRLNEFDKVFIEMYSKNWKVTAGDIDLVNQDDYFLKFQKKVSGLSLNAKLKAKKSNTDFFASGAVVKGKFAKVDFNGQDANQGPYRLTNVNEQFLLIISNSEKVFVDGIPLKRGESNDYIIDYNTAEITFNTTYPITSNMRIHVEFQASEQNFTRFVTFNSANYQSDKFKLKLNVYSENDLKNQTLQQDLSDDQKQILADAGDDVTQMFAQSAVQEAFIENKIQYKKELQNGIETFVFSTDETDTLFSVRFSFVGDNQGDYFVQNTIATGKIFEYIAPINGVKQGNYEPSIQLVAPNKLQIATIKANYIPNKKIELLAEIAISDNDKNLFSKINDSDNQGFAGKLFWSQLLIDKKWQLKSTTDYEVIHKDFVTVQRIQNVEFARDWNLKDPLGNQNKLKSILTYQNEKKGFVQYQFENLSFNENFKGQKHRFTTDLNLKKTNIIADISLLDSDSDFEETTYSRIHLNIKQRFKKSWLGASLQAEDNQRKEKSTQNLTDLSHKSTQYNTYFGVGDSTKVFAEIGYNFRVNDSLFNGELKEVSKANTIYLNSKLIQNKKSSLAFFINYRTIKNVNVENDNALNTRLNYRQKLFNNFISFNTIYENSSGRLAQQEFNYFEVEAGQGFYTWIDFDSDGVQDLDEFEIAQFQDQATYVRVLLPTTKFIKINQSKFSQLFNLDFSKWHKKNMINKSLSHFFNQTTLQIDNKKNRNNTFQFDVFDITSDAILALKYNFKNSLFFNRGKQRFSTTYSYFETQNKTVFSTGNQDNTIKSNQLLFQHRFKKNWLVDISGMHSNSKSIFENFPTRNFDLITDDALGKIAYFYNKSTKFDLSYSYKEKLNSLASNERLQSQKLGLSLQYSKGKKISLNTSFNMIINKFNGNQNSPVGFQMLEGLQDGKNFTWHAVLQKKLTSYLDLNINYNGRKSELLNAIHTGNIQLRANF
jgi:hypothetical protein